MYIRYEETKFRSGFFCIADIIINRISQTVLVTRISTASQAQYVQTTLTDSILSVIPEYT